MKTIHTTYFLAAATLLMNACMGEQTEPADLGHDDCIGVYFVEEQENAKTHTLTYEEDETTLEFIVRRSDISSEAYVNFEAEAYHIYKDKTYTDTSYCEVMVRADDLFEFGEIYFKEGQRETTLKVWFDDIEIGKTYTCSVTITDPEHVSPYEDNASTITFAVQMYQWRLAGKAVYRDALFSDMFLWEGRYLETEVDIYERTDEEGKGYYRLENLYTPEYIARLVEGEEAFEEDPEKFIKEYERYIEETDIIVNATDPEKVYIPVQKTGFTDPSMGDIMIASDVTEVWGAGSNLLYGTLEDGVITFPKNGLLISLGEYFYFSNTSEKARIVLPGGKAEDYAITLSAGEIDADYRIPVTFTPDKDVKKVKYAVFTGKIAGLTMDARIAQINSGQTDVHELEISEETTVDVSIESGSMTGFYTLIACTYDQEGNYKDYASTVLGYVSPGDSRDVNISFNVIVDDHYASEKEEENYDSTNSFQYWVKGKDITHAMFNYYSLGYYNSYKDKIEEELKNAGSIDSGMLKILNEGGLSGIVGNNLKPGTEYIFVVYVGNGYHNAFKTHIFKTGGEEDFMQKSFWYKDFLSGEQTFDAEDYTAHAWVPVSIDVFDADAEGRTIRGNGRKVTFSYEDGWMTAAGLFPSLNVKLKNGKIQKDPKIQFNFSDGYLYTTQNKLDDVFVKDSTHIVPTLRVEHRYSPRIGSISGTGYFYDTYETDDKKERYDMITAGFVHEQVIAFTDNKTGQSFWALLLGGYQMFSDGEGLANFVGEAHGDLLLVREDSPMLAGLEFSDSDSAANGEKLNSVTESNRVDMPAIGSMLRNVKEADFAYEKLSPERKELLDIREGVRIKSTVK